MNEYRLALKAVSMPAGRPALYQREYCQMAIDCFSRELVRPVTKENSKGELALKSQVIYVTHHDHLIDVAHGAMGEQLSVIRLLPGSAINSV